MTTSLMRAAIAALMMTCALPTAAQMAAPPPPPAPPAQAVPPMGGGKWGARAFPSMSEAGRQTMMNAMRGTGDRQQERAGIEAARERMLAILDADRLDTAALKRAMDDERAVAQASHERRQAAMVAAFQQLSVADRKAFVTDSRAMKNRMADAFRRWQRDGRMGRPMRHGMGGSMGGRGPGGMTPPPPPPTGM